MNRRTFVLSLLPLASACRSAPDRQTPRLRLLSYNVHHGEGTDGRLDPARIAAIITQAAPDLVALQEVDRVAARTGSVDQPAEYERLTGMRGWFGAAMPFQGGHYGQMLLSRWPLIDPEVIRLPGTPGREPRIAVTAVVDVPGLGRLRWTGVHLDASRGDEDRWEQAGALVAALADRPESGLLAGDFNARPDSRVMRRVLDPATGWCELTGEGAPGTRIDYLLAHPCPAWQVTEARFLPETVASDHPPVLAEVRRP